MKKFVRCCKKLIRCIMSDYPLLTCHFQVEWGGTNMGFMEVSGLSIEHDVVEHREGNDPNYTSHKIPGQKKYNNIVLKRAIRKGDNSFYDWINTIQLNQVHRRDIIISLLNEAHEPVMVWKVLNAWPVKFEGPILKSDVSELAIETLEIVHEGIIVETF